MATPRPTRRGVALLVAFVVSLGALAACTQRTDDDADAEPGVVADFEITERLPADPFCTEMLSIVDEDLTAQQTAERYRELIPFVPAVLSSDFQTLIDELTNPSDEPVTGSLEEFVDDIGPDTDDSTTPEVPLAPLTSGEVVSAWVDANCRATAVSPLPPPSEPD